MRSLRTVVLALLPTCAGLGQGAPPAKASPQLVLHMENILPAGWPSSQATSDLDTGTLREADSIYRFAPAHPSGPLLERFEIPSPAKSTGAILATTLWNDLFYQSGKDLRRRALDGRTDQLWFTSPRPFASFQVLDANTVALGLVHDPGEPKPILYRSLGKTEAEAANLQFVEIWDVPSRTLTEAYGLPTEVQSLFETVAPFPLHQIWMLRGGSNLLVFLPKLQHLYLLDRGKPRLTRLEVPWPQVDSGWISRALPADRPTAYLFALYFPQTMLACPIEGGGFVFTWNQLPLREDVAVRQEAPAFRGIDGPILRHGPLSKDATPSVSYFHLGEWRPGETSVKTVRGRGRIPLDDNAALREAGWWKEFQKSGMFIDSLLEPMPLPQFFKGLKQTLESRRTPPAPPVPAKATAARPAGGVD